jgi:hypothetical protein
MPFEDDGTPLQRGMLRDSDHYLTEDLSTNKKGIILEVKYSDHPSNRSTMEKNDRRGFLAEAKVWLVEDCAILEHVVIPPSSASGIDDYEESFPRASTKAVTGVVVDEDLSQVDPNKLDGDWCIVSFLESRIQEPFISNWWPNPNNNFDPATSGRGNPKWGTSKGTALDQRGRYFKRTNGIEFVITAEGNTIISTTRAGCKVKLGAVSTDGRFPRSTFDEGGSIITYIKPSQTFELSFDTQVDGIGSSNLHEDSLPQPNPVSSPRPPATAANTKLRATKTEFSIVAPELISFSSKSAFLAEAPSIYLGENAFDKAAKTIPTMANFNALIATVNSLMAAVKLPVPVTTDPVTGTGTTVPAPGGPLTGLVPAPAPQDVAATKVYVE